ncbi:hypothetical protein JTE90_025539 [Oedothorax gibbosus]|uniref:ZSWIM3 N-terminal domain-containing protein n=1 Tax=Oedothorax gibbosus TaxID=931172 RepID=A0AAV6TX89_9ARAC|nr:hypothetical protein JTE90_025539 [Oedothorax gibbosus]
MFSYSNVELFQFGCRRTAKTNNSIEVGGRQLSRLVSVAFIFALFIARCLKRKDKSTKMDVSAFQRGFTTFDLLKEEISKFEEENQIHLYMRDCRKLEKAMATSKSARLAKPELKYYSLKYTCVNGGRNHVKYPNFLNKRQGKTQKIDCPFYIVA